MVASGRGYFDIVKTLVKYDTKVNLPDDVRFCDLCVHEACHVTLLIDSLYIINVTTSNETWRI